MSFSLFWPHALLAVLIMSFSLFCLVSVHSVLTQDFLHSVQLGASVLALLLAGKHLEPFWGSREFIKFIVFVNLFTCASTFALAIFLYFTTRRGDYL